MLHIRFHTVMRKEYAKEITRKIAAVTQSFGEGHNLYDDGSIRDIFRKEYLSATKSGTYSGMWHIQALASTVGHEIHCVYPMEALMLRPILNTVVQPRISSLPPKSHTIMWTRTGPMEKGLPWWAPNHFVACFPRHIITNVEGTDSQVHHPTSALFRTLPLSECAQNFTSTPKQPQVSRNTSQPKSSLPLPVSQRVQPKPLSAVSR